METGVQMPVRTPKFLGSYETAQLVNEAYQNDGRPSLFTDADLEHFRTGDDPYGHPDVNWYDEIFKESAQQSNVNVDVSGGSERLKYFVSVGYFSQDGLVRDFDSGDDLNSNYRYRRFNFRSNLDLRWAYRRLSERRRSASPSASRFSFSLTFSVSISANFLTT